MSFLEGLIQAKPPLKPFVDAETNLSVFISLLWPKVHFLKVTRVVTLAPPNEVHPYHSTERRYLPSWRSYQNKSGIPCLWALEVKPKWSPTPRPLYSIDSTTYCGPTL